MHQVARCGLGAWSARISMTLPYNGSPQMSLQARGLASKSLRVIPHFQVPDLSYACQPRHSGQVAEQLKHHGLVKISLPGPDPDSSYLQQLLFSLHHHHGHQLPIAHSAERGWFWDVRPTTMASHAGSHQARSETMDQFSWHTDCSYETLPPRYFALHVLQHDRYGGGTLSVMDVELLCRALPPATRSALMRPDYQITIPAEFIKDPDQRHISGRILFDGSGNSSALIRFRGDIVTPADGVAARALLDLGRALQDPSVQRQSTLSFSPEALPKDSIILIDNRRWLHARNHIKDPERHLRRVRWDAVPFEPPTS